jgi:multiple sugar transport system substrate-binding protein
MVFKSNPDQEKLALELVKFLMRDEYNLLACKELGQLPTLKSLAADPYFQLPENKPFVEQLQHTIEMEPLAVLDEIANEILKAISLVVIAEELTPEEAVKQAAANAREILKASVK